MMGCFLKDSYVVVVLEVQNHHGTWCDGILGFESHLYEFIAGVQKSILGLRAAFYNEFVVQRSFYSFPI